MDPVVVDRVKCLGCIEKEDMTVDAFCEVAVEEVVDVDKVFCPVNAVEEAFLARVHKIFDGRQTAPCDSRGQDAVVSIGHTQWPCIAYEPSVLLR